MKLKYGLTKRQLEAFNYIKSYIHKHGYSPSYHEIMMANNYKSKSAIHQIVNNLEKRKWLKKIPGTARSLTLAA